MSPITRVALSVALVLLVVIVLLIPRPAGCSGRWPDSFRRHHVSACTEYVIDLGADASSAREFCTCYVGEIERRVTYERIRNISDMTDAQLESLGPDLQAAASICIGTLQ